VHIRRLSPTTAANAPKPSETDEEASAPPYLCTVSFRETPDGKTNKKFNHQKRQKGNKHMANINGTGLQYVIYPMKAPGSEMKYYARLRSQGIVSFEQLISHISSHASVYDRSVIAGVLYKMQDCLLELLFSGWSVRLSDFGMFRLSLHTNGVKNPSDFDIGTLAQGLQLHFLPNQSDQNKLTQKALLEAATMTEVADYQSPRTAGDATTTGE